MVNGSFIEIPHRKKGDAVQSQTTAADGKSGFDFFRKTQEDSSKWCRRFK
jgi:hypothetical protein